VAEAANARLKMLAGAYDLLARGDWETVPLEELIREVMAPFAPNGGARVLLDGASIVATPKATLALAMVLYELAAEAAQSGALAAPDGRVEIAWSLRDGAADGRRFSLRWQERGGPSARSPESGDVGLDRIQRIAREELRGSLQTASAADGWRAELDMPFASELLRLDGAAAP
jgi:two-component sensor histidine kinase